MRTRQAGHRIVLFGAALDTGNLGVSALGVSTLVALHRRGVAVTSFGNGRGHQMHDLLVGDELIRYESRGAWLSRRLYRPESLRTMAAVSAIRLPQANPNLDAIRRSDAVFDISGGDSFTDLYGPKRFQMVTLPKKLALQQQRALLLLPQTYGPFRDAKRRSVASSIVRRARQVWARDEDSFERLADLAGRDFDPERHRLGIDVAFGLPAAEPVSLGDELDAWLRGDEPVVGLNVSGLLFNEPEGARRTFGLTADYPAAVRRFLTRLLGGGYRVVLVPHVLGTSTESDVIASERLASEFTEREPVMLAPSAALDAPTAKWLISRLTWFTGARMHATIAALSSAVPVMATAYSAKTAGVFETCGVRDEVVDARRSSTTDLVDGWWDALSRREQVRGVLSRTAPLANAAASAQFDEIMAAVPAGGPR